jgi:hypothetical protein
MWLWLLPRFSLLASRMPSQADRGNTNIKHANREPNKKTKKRDKKQKPKAKSKKASALGLGLGFVPFAVCVHAPKNEEGNGNGRERRRGASAGGGARRPGPGAGRPAAGGRQGAWRVGWLVLINDYQGYALLVCLVSGTLPS